MKILVSACLLGACTRYDGQSVPNKVVLMLCSRHTLIPVCPEQLGGLPTPRASSEQCGAHVISTSGEDFTSAFERGANEAMNLYRMLSCEAAILKAKSPSCGCGWIYDGSFSRKLIAGDGILTKKLKQAGEPVYTDTDERIENL